MFWTDGIIVVEFSVISFGSKSKLNLSPVSVLCCVKGQEHYNNNVGDYPDEPVPEETLTHPPSWSSFNLYQLLPSTAIHSILPVQIMHFAMFLHNLSPCPLWSTSWSGALHLIFHTFLHAIIVFFSQHMPKSSQPILLYQDYFRLFPVYLSTPYLELYLLP